MKSRMITDRTSPTHDPLARWLRIWDHVGTLSIGFCRPSALAPRNRFGHRARFKHLAWHRHWTTHGTIETPSFMGQTWRSYRGFVSFLKENISTRELESLDLHLSDLEEMGDEALRLFSDIVHWKAYDLGCETPKKTEKVLRKISVRLP